MKLSMQEKTILELIISLIWNAKQHISFYDYLKVSHNTSSDEFAKFSKDLQDHFVDVWFDAVHQQISSKNLFGQKQIARLIAKGVLWDLGKGKVELACRVRQDLDLDAAIAAHYETLGVKQ